MKINKIRWALIGIFCLASVLIFWRLAHVDLIGDDAHYTFRALGLVDFLLSPTQTTPLDWYTVLPFWTSFSFHDHPLLIFLIHHFFLNISDSAFFVRLPFALFGLGTIWFTYQWVKKMFGESAGLLSALTLVVSADFIALSRRPLMEIGVMFFISLAMYYFSKFVHHYSYWWKFGIAFGLLVEAKFTTVFVLPVLLGYILSNPDFRKNILFLKKFSYAMVVAAGIALPVLVYNVMMLIDRGHMSYQFARLFPNSSPWKAGGINANTSEGFVATITQLGHWFSWPLIICLVVVAIYLLCQKNYRKYSLIILPLFFFFIEDLLIGAHDLYPIVIAPLVGVGFAKIPGQISNQKKFIWYIIAGLFFTYLLFYTIYSNHVNKNQGPLGWTRMSTEPKNFGLSQLDEYLTDLTHTAKAEGDLDVYDVYPEIKRKTSQLTEYYLPDQTLFTTGNKIQNVILYDNSINWFPRFWVFARRLFYNNEMYISTKTLPPMAKTLGYTPRVSYFIKATEYTRLEQIETEGKNPAVIEQNLIQAGVEPIKTIYRDDGLPAFKIYKIPKDLRFKFE